MADEMYDVVVVGGGPAGMSAAWELRDKRVLLIEESARLGGRLYSLPRGKYWMNLGGHLFPPPGAHVRNMMTSVGLDTIPIPGNKFAIWFAGKVYSPRSVAMLPFILPMKLRERIALARIGLTLMSAVRGMQKAVQPREGETDWARRARVARYLSDKPLRALIGRPPERVDAIFRSAGRRTAAELEDESAGVGAGLFAAVWAGKKDGTGLNLDGGSGRLGVAMAEALGERVELNAKALSVARSGGAVDVTYEKGGVRRTVSAAQVIVATPAFTAAALVKDLPDDVAGTLRDVQYGPFPSMGIITNETGPMPWDDIYAITTPGAAFDMLFNHANPVRTGKVREPGGSLMVYCGGAPAREMLKLSDDEIRAKYLADLYRIYPQLRSIIVETVVQRWNPGNTYRPEGFNFDPVLAYSERTDTDIHFAGDYFAQSGAIEVAASTGNEAARRARARLMARRTAPAQGG